MSLSRAQSQRLLNDALDSASFDDVRVSLSAAQSGHARFGDSMPTTCGDVERVRVRVTAVTSDGRRASVEGNRVDRTGLARLVSRAELLAARAPVDPERMPPRGKTTYLDVGSFDRAVGRMDAASRIPFVEAAIAAGQAEKLAMSGFLRHDDMAEAVADRAGLFAYHRGTQVSLGTTARTADGTGSSKQGMVSHRLSDLDAGELARTATQWSLRSRSPTALEPGRYTVLLMPQAVSDLMGFFLYALDHRAAAEGRSYFAGAAKGKTNLGEALFHPSITLSSDPTNAANPATPMTRAGAPHGVVSWVERGTLQALSASRYWAQQADVPARPIPSSLHMSGTDLSFEKLLEGVERGVLVTRFWYNRMLNPRTLTATGLTRDGTFLIRKGMLARPIKNLRYNDSPLTLLSRVAALGKPRRAGLTLERTDVVPPMVVEGFRFEGSSDAV